jgi:hypothetical protein
VDQAQRKTGECSIAEAPPLWLIIATVASYLAFTVAFGEEIFDTNLGDCSGLISCTADVFSMIGGFFQLMTLGGFTSPLPVLIQGPLLVFFAFTWGPLIFDLITAGIDAVTI